MDAVKGNLAFIGIVNACGKGEDCFSEDLFELERIEEYIKKCNNKYKYDDEYKKYIKYNSIANKYPAFPKIFSMQFHKNGKEVIEDN